MVEIITKNEIKKTIHKLTDKKEKGMIETHKLMTKLGLYE